MKLTRFLFLGWLLLSLSFAQSPQPVENSLLWEISGKGVKKASYLYGTVHLIPQDSFFLPPDMKTMLEQSEQLVLEIPLDFEMSNMMGSMMKMMLPTGTSLTDLMDSTDYELVKAYVSDSLGMPFVFLQRLKPIFLAQQVSSSGCGWGEPTAQTSYEMYFAEQFKQAEKLVVGLETMEDQMGYLDQIPLDEQAQSLVEAVKDPDAGCEEFGQMLRMYRQQDLSAMMEMAQASAELGSYLDKLLDERNQNWIPVLQEILPENRLFIAVGAAHLAGPQGLVSLLRKAGYQVKPVVFEVE